MDIATFTQSLKKLICIPKDVLIYAEQTGNLISDGDRSVLFSRLQEIHKDVLPLEKEQTSLAQEALGKIAAFKRRKSSKERVAIEAKEQTTSLSKLKAFFE